jgi:ankyrin repeat protein
MRSKLSFEMRAKLNLALHEAVREQNYEKCKELLKKGANVNNSGVSGQTPLHWRVNFERYGIVRLLLEYGADVNAQDEYGNTPLHAAVESYDYGKVVLLVLAKQELDVHIRNHKGDTAYDIASRFGMDRVMHDLFQLIK